MIRVLVVDDHAVVRDGLTRLLNSAGDMTVVAGASDGAEALQLLPGARPDVVLMDLSMPGMDGVAATRHLAADHPEVKVVVLTSFADQRRILDALNAGAGHGHPCLLTASPGKATGSATATLSFK